MDGRTDDSVNLNSLLSCDGEEKFFREICSQATISPSDDLNVTASSFAETASVIFPSGSFSVRYLTVIGCVAVSVIELKQTARQVMLDESNFISSVVPAGSSSKVAAVGLAVKPSMIVRTCIFKGN
jgi:hypothetical protein